MKIDVKSLRPILQPKKKPEVKDPPRYPNVINAYEDEAKRSFTAMLQKSLRELAEEMVSLKS